MLKKYQVVWSITRCSFFFKTESRIYKLNTKCEKKQKNLKKKKFKIYTDSELYPTDFRKKRINAENGLIIFLMSGGKFLKCKNILKKTYSLLYYLLMFNVSTFLKKKYKFFETLGQIILHDSTWFIFNNLLTYFLLKIKPYYYIRCVSIAKTFKKKKKILRISPYRFFLRKLPQHKRFNFAIKEFSLLIRANRSLFLPDRILYGLLEIFMLDKKSLLYKKKIKYHRKALRAYIIEKTIN